MANVQKYDIIELLVEVVIFTALFPTIASAITNPDGNITGTTLVLYSLIALFVMIGFIMKLVKITGASKKR